MSFQRQSAYAVRKAPAIDSAQAQADAKMFLVGARTIAGLTADTIAHRHRLSLKMATYFLTLEQGRRAERGE